MSWCYSTLQSRTLRFREGGSIGAHSHLASNGGSKAQALIQGGYKVMGRCLGGDR